MIKKMNKPARKRKPSIYYKTEMVKVKNKILWRAVEMPSKLVLKESFFEEDVKKLVKFQNQHKTFGVFGFPTFFDIRESKERLLDNGKSSYNHPPTTRGRR
jgi:hypothetical protein